MAKSYYQQYNKPRVHVQVWTEVNGPIPKGYVVDHINGDIHDNSLSNLRLATVSENIRNSKISVSNKTGIKGVSWDKTRGRYRATIRAGEVYSYRGSLIDCVAWIYRMRKELHGEFARFK